MSKLVKIKNSDGSKIYSVITSTVNEELNITILDGESSYTCQVNIEDAVEFANSFQIDVDSYMETLHQQLSGATTATMSVIDDHLNVYKNKNIIYFVKKVEKCNYNSKLESILEDIFAENLALQLRVDVLEEEKRTAIDDYTTLKVVLEEKVKDNANYEKKLLSSFVLLLNEKKRRIQYLTDLIEAEIIKTIPPKKVKLSDEPESSIGEPKPTTQTNIEVVDTSADNPRRECMSTDEDEDEDFLLRSPVESPNGGDCAANTSLPKREPSKTYTAVSFREKATEEAVSQDTESQSKESGVSSQGVFTTQDCLDRMYN